MKLTKENVYVSLQGKTKEELKELELITGLDSIRGFNYLHFNTHEGWNRWWAFTSWESDITKTEITIDQLKQIIKPMGTFTPISMKCTQEQFDAFKPKLKDIGKIGDLRFAFENDNLYLVNNYNGEPLFFDISYCDGWGRKVHQQWNEEIFLKACGIEVETLQEKAIRLENELNEVKQQIEEENKPKLGDWVKNKFGTIFKLDKMVHYDVEKITNPELIKLLEQEIK